MDLPNTESVTPFSDSLKRKRDDVDDNLIEELIRPDKRLRQHGIELRNSSSLTPGNSQAFNSNDWLTRIQWDDNKFKNVDGNAIPTLSLQLSEDSSQSVVDPVQKIHGGDSSSIFSGSSESETFLPPVASDFVIPPPQRRDGLPMAPFKLLRPPESKPTTSQNLNEHITTILEDLQRSYQASSDHWRSFAYTKAIRAIKAAKFRIESREQAASLGGIGARILDKITEIIETGRLRRAEADKKNEMLMTITLFSRVWGIGSKKANQLAAAGYKTLEDLKRAPLSSAQKIGLQYFYDFEQRIPRAEVAAIGQLVADAAHAIDPKYKVVIVGSFRRGRPDSGDVDILTTHFREEALDGFLQTLLAALHTSGLLIADLTDSEGRYDSRWYMGVCRLPQYPSSAPGRRIDIKVLPRNEWGTGLLAWTGSDHFNRSLRLWAQKCGYSLSDHALSKRLANDEKGEAIPIRREEDVFRVLGLEYKAPEERNV